MDSGKFECNPRKYSTSMCLIQNNYNESIPMYLLEFDSKSAVTFNMFSLCAMKNPK